jgi:DNA-binding transcriptional MocR family regulator
LHIRIWNIMQNKQQIMSPHDIVILLKIASHGDEQWFQKPLAEDLGISQSEISKSLNRSKYAGLIDPKGKKVMKHALLEFLQFGLRYVFPQKPGAVVRGIPTSHSAAPLKNQIQSAEHYVWPYAKGTVRGQSIIPLYPSVPEAALKDAKLYELLALVDALRVGRAREKELAIVEIKTRLGFGK